MIALLIGSDDYSTLMSGNRGATFSLQVSAKGQATVELEMKPSSPLPIPVTGKRLRLFDDGLLVFNGLITNVDKTWASDIGNFRPKLTAMSLEHLVDKRQISPRRYANMTCGAIVTDLINTLLGTGSFSEEGIGLGDIQPGATVTRVYDNTPFTDALDELAATSSTDATAWDWDVSADTSLLNFRPRGAVVSPFAITVGKQISYLSPNFSFDQKDLRTRQKIRIDFSAFAQDRIFLVGDGSTTVFTTDANGNAFKPFARIDSVIQTADTFASVVGTLSGNPNDGDTITVGAIVYTFKTALDNTQPFQIHIDPDPSQTLINIVLAINGDNTQVGTPRFRYSLPTYLNTDCLAFLADAPTLVLQARLPGSDANGTPVSSTSAAFTWSFPTLTGGLSGAVAQPFQAQSVGLTGEVGNDWTYDQGGTTLTAAVAPADGAGILILYRQLGGDVLAVENTAAVAARATLEQSSGVYETTIDASQLSDPVATNALAAIARIQGVLASFGDVAAKLVFDTRPVEVPGGLLPGQVLSITAPAPFDGDANGNWLIQQIDASQIFDIKHFKYRVTCVGRSRSIPTKRFATPLQFWKQAFLTGRKAISGGGPGGGGIPDSVDLLSQYIFDATAAGLVVASTTNLDIQHPSASVFSWLAVAEFPSTSDDIIIDITLRDGTSILDSNKITIPQGIGDIVSGANFTSIPYPVLDISTLQGKVVQGGNGARVQVKLYGTRRKMPPNPAPTQALPVI